MTTYATLDLRHLMVDPGEERKRAEWSYLRFITTGVEFGVALVALTLLGVWLDGWAHTSPVLTIVFALLGLAVATWNLLRSVLQSPDPPFERKHPK